MRLRRSDYYVRLAALLNVNASDDTDYGKCLKQAEVEINKSK